MNYRIVDNYKLADKITETYGACLYKAQNSRDIDSEEEYFYVVKEYYNNIIPRGTLEREKKISHEIENHAPKSIVIPILDVISDGEQEYAVMQFRKNGMFLNELIEKLEIQYGKGNIPLEVSLEIISEILHSLEVLHSFWKKDRQVGYLHLDLHPGNIFFESTDIEKMEIGKAKFIDFLSALKIEKEEVILQEDAMISVNYKYSSPEQKEREYYKYRPATDLYSVGAIFLRILIGQVGVNEDDMAEKLLPQMAGKEESSIIQQMLCTFLKCSLEENPKYRYQSAKDMLRAVKRLENCYKAYQGNDYYTLFSNAYEMVISSDKADTFSNLHIGKFRDAVTQLDNDTRQNRINVPRCKYLFDCLYNCMKVQKDTIPADITNKLYSSGIACYNHIGDSLRAKELYDEIEKIKQDISLMEYLGCLNRAAVIYADRYEFEKAYDIVCGNIKSLELIKDMYQQVANQNGIESTDESSRIIDLARAYSAKGTYMILAQKGNPMPEFKKSLDEFGNSMGNKAITLSHMLQYAIEIQDKQLYEEYKNAYFGEYSTLSKGIDLVTDEKRFHEYTVLTFLKGVYTFYMKDVDSECRDKICGLLNAQVLKELHSHPLHLIYKYIGLILYEYHQEVTEDVESAMFASMTCLEQVKINFSLPINIMMCMNYQTMWIYNELTEQKEENEELLKIMMEHCKNSGWEKLYCELERMKNIKEVLRYEYC